MIADAIRFLDENVYDPALNHPALSEELKNQVRASMVRVHKMKKIGDLNRYLERFVIDGGLKENLKVYAALRSLSLQSCEELLPKFQEKFKEYLFDISRLSDFVIGHVYSSSDLANASGNYNIVAGITPVGEAPNYDAVFVKGFIGGDRYSNEWLVPGLELKYFFYSRDGLYSKDFKFNAAIIGTPNVRIYVFLKDDSEGKEYRFNGIFQLIKPVYEADGKNWFHLRKSDIPPANISIAEQAYQEDQLYRLNEMRGLPVEKLRAIAEEQSKSEYVQVISLKRKRNIAVVELALKRADGICEDCKIPAPFNRASNGTPYLEVHHVIFMAYGGEDTLANTLALCPNCHRKRHFGI